LDLRKASDFVIARSMTRVASLGKVAMEQRVNSGSQPITGLIGRVELYVEATLRALAL
jgi:hypothetical protein